MRIALATDARRVAPTAGRVVGWVPGQPMVGGVVGGVVQGVLQSVAFPAIARDVSNTETDLALDLGGGVSFVILRGLSLDLDLRLYRVFGDDEFNVLRFGSGASYRF